MVEQMKEEQMLVDGEDGKLDDELSEEGKVLAANGGGSRRAHINTTTAKVPVPGRTRAFGSVLSSEKEESLDSDFEIEGEDASDIDSDLDDEELMNLNTGEDDKGGSAKPKPEKLDKKESSDDDF